MKRTFHRKADKDGIVKLQGKYYKITKQHSNIKYCGDVTINTQGFMTAWVSMNIFSPLWIFPHTKEPNQAIREAI